jgi:preprotein translocase subunit SecE
MTLLGILIVLLVFGLIYWAANALMGAFGIGDPIRTVVIVLLVVLFIVYLLGVLGYGPGLSLT